MTESVLGQLEHTLVLANQSVNFDDLSKVADLQSHYCCVLQSSFKRLGAQCASFADRSMNVFLMILNNHLTSKASSLYEDVLMAIGYLLSEVGQSFGKYLSFFFPKLLEAINNRSDHSVKNDTSLSFIHIYMYIHFVQYYCGDTCIDLCIYICVTYLLLGMFSCHRIGGRCG